MVQTLGARQRRGLQDALPRGRRCGCKRVGLEQAHTRPPAQENLKRH